MTGNDGYAGQAGLTASTSDRNAHGFQTDQHIAEVRTTTIVKVVAVHGGGVGPDPTVDVQILTHQTDGQGNITPHGTIYGVPAPRNQSGNGVIINDPVVGDVGHMHSADRDISTVLKTMDAAAPGSNRRHSPSDGIFARGHNTKGTPKQYVQFREDGVTVVDMHGNKLVSDKDGWHITGNLTVSGGVTAGSGGSDSVTLQGHTHPTAPMGPASAPTAGT